MWIQLNFGGGGQGARMNKDGNNGNIMFGTNNKRQSVEILETTFPMRYEEFSLLSDSGGPGRTRGGLGCTYTWHLTSPNCILFSEADRTRFSPFGVYGGLPPKLLACGHASCTQIRTRGKPYRHAAEINGSSSPSKWANIKILKGDSMKTIVTGGGGFGDPSERDPEMVLCDVINGYVTPQSAERWYGVMISRKRMEVHQSATEKLRSKMRQ